MRLGSSKMLEPLLKNGGASGEAFPAHVLDDCMRHAAAGGMTKCVRALLAAGASPHTREVTSGLTPLHLACRAGSMSTAALLIQTIDADSTNKRGGGGGGSGGGSESSGAGISVSVSVSSGGGGDGCDGTGEGRGKGASEQDEKLLAKMLAWRSSEGGYSPLHLSVLSGSKRCVKLIASLPGVDVNATDANGLTPSQLVAVAYPGPGKGLILRECLRAAAEGDTSSGAADGDQKNESVGNHIRDSDASGPLALGEQGFGIPP